MLSHLYIPRDSAPFILTIAMASQFPPFKPFIVKPWSRPGDRSKDEIAREARHSWPDKPDFRSVARGEDRRRRLHPHPFLFSASLRALPLISNRDPSPFSRVSLPRVWNQRGKEDGRNLIRDWLAPTIVRGPRLSSGARQRAGFFSRNGRNREEIWGMKGRGGGGGKEGVAFLFLRFIRWNASWARIFARFIRNQCSVKKRCRYQSRDWIRWIRGLLEIITRLCSFVISIGDTV